jgi:serine/threonine-protein kinase
MPAVGDVLAGRYRVDGILGAGGMATVYRATDMRLEREVAVKVLLPNLARDPSLAERFDREARLLASVTHPSIAEIFDVEPGDAEAVREPFYVMELCEGGSLADRIAAAGHIEPGEVVPLIVAVAAGLGELHRRGLIHRDVKPANILFTGGRPKLADFGLARTTGRPEFPTLTDPGTAIGTPAYMAPELVSGAGPTTASDVYALGATTFHALTGRAPRQSETITGLATAMGEPVPLASSIEPGLGSAFDALLTRTLATDPGDRPDLNAFTSELVAALAAGTVPVIADAPVDPLADTTRIPTTPTVAAAVPVAAPAAASSRRPPARQGGRSGATSLAVLAAVVAVILLALPRGGDPGTPLATATPVVSVPASPSAQPTASPAASPTPTPDPAAPALAALDRVVVAVDGAKVGHDGLNGESAAELLDAAAEIRRELEAGDFRAARTAAERLADKADKATKGLDAQRAAALRDAIAALIEAIPA